MKKILLAFTLIFSLLLTGCSCSTSENLSFSSPWGKDKDVSGVIETATYDITFDTDFSVGDAYQAKQDSDLKDKFNVKLDDEFNGGKGYYTTELKIIDTTSPDAQIDGEYLKDTSDILSDSTEPIISYKTEAIIKGTYQLNGKDKQEFEDVIITESFFLRANQSLAPVYSRTLLSVTNVAISGSGDELSAAFGKTSLVSTILYNKEEYVLKVFRNEVIDENNVDDKADRYIESYLARNTEYLAITPTETDDYDNTFKEIIDNSELLFATRCMSFESTDESNNSVLVPVVSHSFGEETELAFNNVVNNNTSIKLKVDGASAIDMNVPTKNVTFSVNATNSGRAKLAVVQYKEVKNENEDTILANRSLLVKYVEPLTEYNTSSFRCLGAYVFTLTETSFN